MVLNFPVVNDQTLRFAALWYAARGIRVFPAHPDAKTPMVRWSDQATTDWQQIRDWWIRWPNANVGLAMGDGWHCLDVDVGKHDDDGEASYVVAGGLPWSDVPHPVQFTPGGGKHLLFRAAGSFKNFTRKGARGGLDMRSGGGYILVSPSVVDGKPYRWAAGGDVEAPLPDALLHWIQSASAGQRLDHTASFPLVAPSDLTEGEKRARINALPAPERAFLVEGRVSGGDASATAWRACRTAFTWGWSLADMAAIGPETALGSFGAEPPHGAADPWGWCWKYIVHSAWEASDGQRIEQLFNVLETEGEGDAGGLAASKTEGNRTPGNPPGPESTVDAFERLSGRVRSVQPGDVRAVEALLLVAAGLDLDALRVDTLFRELKTFAGVGVGALRERYKLLTSARRAKDAKVRKAGESATEVLIRDQGKLYDRLSGQLITERAFALARAREHGGDTRQVLDHWLTGAGALCECVESLSYDPALPSGVATDWRGIRVFNTYRGGGVVPVAGDVSLWLGLLDSLAVQGGPRCRDMLLDFLAYLVQHPEGKTAWGVLLGGRHGIGKDSFLAPVLEIVGRANTKIVSGEEVATPAFNDYLADCKLLLINEIKGQGTAETLKPALATPPDVLRVNRKNLRPYEIPNRLALVAMTNHRFPFPLDPGERRWLCLWADLRLPTDPGHPTARQWSAFFERYWTWVKSGTAAVAAVAHWLHERDLSAFQPGTRPAVTDWQQELTSDAMDAMDEWIMEKIAEKTGAFALAACDIPSIAHDAMQVGFRLGGEITAHRVRRALARCGVPRRRVSGLASSYAYFPRGVVPVTLDVLQRLKTYGLKAGVIG